MRLPRALYRLPLAFDPAPLRAEVARLPGSAWLTHPSGYPGNSAVPLITPGGLPSDAFAVAGALAPAASLEALPAVRGLLAALPVTLSRTRLMRLDPGAAVPKHRDLGAHWLQRARLHLPLQTQPGVRFACDGEDVHMGAGEVWTFDNSRSHEVHNPGPEPRIHLVVDVRDGAELRDLLARSGGPTVRLEAAGVEAELSLEPGGFEVFPPALFAELLEAVLTHGAYDAETVAALRQLAADYAAAFAEHGQSLRGEQRYAWLSRRARELIGEPPRAAEVEGLALGRMLRTTNRRAALSPTVAPPSSPAPSAPPGWDEPLLATRLEALPPLGERLREHLAPFRAPRPPAEVWGPAERPTRLETLARLANLRLLTPLPAIAAPVFVVCPPRAGSGLLFETLAQAPGVWTVGGEHHGWLEGQPALGPAARGWSSNRLTAADLEAADVPQLLAWLAPRLRDRAGARWLSLPADARRRPLRLLAKLPKDALRVPFLKALFPAARFLLLTRAPGPSLASLLAGWRSGRYVTYPLLPGWRGRAWSFLLPEGWRGRDAAPLAELVAFQWGEALRTLLDDLEQLPASDVAALRYEDLVRDPRAAVGRLAHVLGWELDARWAQALEGPLPWSRTTLSPPDPSKWRVHATEIEPLLPRLDPLHQRAQAFAAAHG